jgi:hypothetical protein
LLGHSLCSFPRKTSATFGAGVNASHCPITRPKRRKQPKRYVPLDLKFIEKNKTKIVDKGYKKWYI